MPVMDPVAIVTETPPRLHGDGVRDDTAAVQWYLDRDMDLPRSTRGYRVGPLSLPPGVGVAMVMGDGWEVGAAPRLSAGEAMDPREVHVHDFASG